LAAFFPPVFFFAFAAMALSFETLVPDGQRGRLIRSCSHCDGQN
jgi:hypothetical protein